ncbi:hypothetical protein X805_20140 [Sphaerotilus natans subsp. natans DSM 6575]|uniref:TonB C-terminal domain-containing protein n=1 Tax=Sphaerotilus natans subsp. natans DSM 6575 TaxID=1286631 RepID=A0A059KMF7_9BURK|nr:hypothetical protein [Sphaerotilus natans]KDB52399.1 hypothetical protein X805_20140 [Sphaerotilus natans subsp. natans DSM 6575]SIR72049.1 protein TonB [Sphaerotilus natans]
MAGAELSRAGAWLPVSLLLHAALLAAALARGGEPAASGAAATARATGELSVRLAAAPTARPPEPDTTRTPVRPEHAARDMPPSMPEPAPGPIPDPTPDPAHDPVPQPLPPPGAGTPQAAVAPMPSPSGAESNDGSDDTSDDDSTYLAPEQLDRRARAAAAIDLPYPELAPPGQFRAALTLFIEADGRVSRVRLEPDADAADGGSLPPVLEDSARQAFLASPFEPGELDGRAVRSRLRIEVQFRDD